MAMALRFILVAMLLVEMNMILGRKLTRCEFVSELKAHGITSNLRGWTCLAEHESGLDTNAVGGPNRDGSFDYGIFQINSRYWCSQGACHMKCKGLINNDISDDIECAKKILSIQGFQAWVAWRNKCQHTLPDVSNC